MNIILNWLGISLIALYFMGLGNILYLCYHIIRYKQFKKKDLMNLLILMFVNYPLTLAIPYGLPVLFGVGLQSTNYGLLFFIGVMLVILTRYLVYKYVLKLDTYDVFMTLFGIYLIGTVVGIPVFYYITNKLYRKNLCALVQ